MKRVPVVAIIGRSNVGKSSLFNVMARKGSAVIDDFPGVTRDRNYCLVTKFGFPFSIVDTGGVLGEEHDALYSSVRYQAELAITEADLIVCLFDGLHGIHPQDSLVVDILRRSNKPVLWVVNKCESPAVQTSSAEFYSFGISDLITVSAAHGVGVKELIAKIREKISEIGLLAESPVEDKDAEEDPNRPIRVAIVGKPNVGKSTLINKILGSDRLVVSSVPGTTRDSIDIELKREGQDYVITDTAGLRKKANVDDETVERFSNMRTLRALATSDVAVLLIDALEFINEQDTKIAGLIHERGRGFIIAINKWDLVEKDNTTVKDFEKAVRESLKFCPYAPIVYISGLTGQRCPSVLDVAKKVYHEARRRIPTATVNKVLERAFGQKPAPAYRGDSVKLLFATQTNVAPPEFVLFLDHPKGILYSYERYIRNQLRSEFGFEGSDIKLVFKKRRAGGDREQAEEKGSKKLSEKNKMKREKKDSVKNRKGKNRTEKNRKGKNKTEKNKTEENKDRKLAANS